MLEVNDQVASGTLDVSADEVILETDGTPLYGDLEVRATVAEGDLATKRFDLSGTTVRLDDIVDETLSEKKQAKLEAWYCDVLLQRGTITVGKPTEISGSVEIRMFDTRAVLAALKKLGVGPKWIGMAPNIKDVAGSVDVEVREDLVVIDRLSMTGDGFESLGWMRVDNKTTNARLFAKFKAVAAGVAIVDGKTKVILAKPRKWFDEQPAGAGP
jgi:hypothetical protein